MSRTAENKEPTHSLASWLAYLESIGAKLCTCRYEWRSLSWRYGWVRMNTAKGCLEHDPA